MAFRSSSRRLVLALLLAATPATAAPADDAEALVRKGVELRKQHKDAAALEQFRRANELHATPRAKAQMALAEQALNLWLEAEEHLREAMSAESDPWIMQNKDALAQAQKVIDQNLGWVDVRSNAPLAEVWLNGRRVTVGRSRVVAGGVQIDVRAEGHEPQTRAVRISPGAELEQSFALEAIRTGHAPASSAVRATSPTTARERLPPPSSSRTTVGLIVGGAGVLALGAGTLFGLRAIASKDEKAEHCDDTGCDDVGLRAHDDGTTAATLSTVGFGVGIVAVGVGLYLILTAPRSTPALTARPNGAAFTIRL